MKWMSKLSEHRVLLGIVAGAFALRFIGLWYGLPAMYNSDEPFNVINALAYGAKQSLEPTYFVYPALHSYVLLAAYGVFFVLGRGLGVFNSALDFGAAYFLDPSGIFWVGRLVSVLAGVFAVWCVYRIGERFFSRQVGGLSAVVLALSFAHADVSHWVLPEALLAMMSALALLSILRLLETCSVRQVLLAGVLCGLAISTKYNAGFIICPLFLAVVFASRGEAAARTRSLFVATAGVAAGFLLGSPYWILSFNSYWQVLQYTFSHVSSGMVGHVSGVPLVWPLLEMIVSDWSVGLLMVSGLLFAFTKLDRKTWLLLSFVLPTVVVVGLWQRSGIHYLLPVFPVLALLAGLFLTSLLQQISHRQLRWVVAGALFVPALFKIGLHDVRLSRTDTRTEARAWIESNIPIEAMIGYENYVYGPNLFDPARYVKNKAESGLLPVAIKERLLEESLRRKTYKLINLRKDFKLKALAQESKSNNKRSAYIRQLLENRLPRISSVQRAGVRYLMISSDNYFRYFQEKPPDKGTPVWLSYKNGRRFYESLFESSSWSLLREFTPTFLTPGPTVRLYRHLPRPDDRERE